MATGLPTFDAFSWASLMAGRQVLVIDRLRPQALGLAFAFEEAGAVVTIAPGQAIGADRLRDQAFSLAVLSLADGEPVSRQLAPALAGNTMQWVVLAPPPIHADLRLRFAEARIGDHSMSDREIILFTIGTPDE